MNWPKVDEREARFEQGLTDSRLSDFNNNIPRQGSRGGKKNIPGSLPQTQVVIPQRERERN